MIRAIQTRYDGRHFRSRAEARWAVFFNALEIPYEYEPEGFVLEDGRRYLPDFRLQLTQTGGSFILWVEVKPSDWNDDKKLETFAKSIAVGEKAVVLPSIEAYSKNPYDLQVWMHDEEIGLYGDTGHCFCACPNCGAVGFEFSGEYDRLNCCGAHRHFWKKHSVERALNDALSERFST